MLLCLQMFEKVHKIVNVCKKKCIEIKKKNYVCLLTTAYAILHQLQTYNDKKKVSLLDMHITE